LTSKNDELKQALKDESTETETLRSATEALMQVWQRVSQSMHEQAAQAQSAAGEGASGGDSSETSAPDAGADGDEDVVEGEIVDEGGAS
jgi:hypothetical protein